MKLRKLKLVDAPYMLEWMHDKSVVENMNRDFSVYTKEDCERFIINSLNDKNNVHLAIVDSNDEYFGTISLKNIDNINKNAEFGITLRKVAMGKGIASWAMKEIIQYGKETLRLERIYWCVSPENIRAVRFYDKNMYNRIEYLDLGISAEYSKDLIDKYIWYYI